MMVQAIRKLCEVFSTSCEDSGSMHKIIELCNALEAGDWKRSQDAKPLFNEIRDKTLVAERAGNDSATIQCSFEESCAKSLFNLGHSQGGFDSDSPFYIVPFALNLGKDLGHSVDAVLRLTTEPTDAPDKDSASAPSS